MLWLLRIETRLSGFSVVRLRQLLLPPSVRLRNHLRSVRLLLIKRLLLSTRSTSFVRLRRRKVVLLSLLVVLVLSIIVHVESAFPFGWNGREDDFLNAAVSFLHDRVGLVGRVVRSTGSWFGSLGRD